MNFFLRSKSEVIRDLLSIKIRHSPMLEFQPIYTFICKKSPTEKHIADPELFIDEFGSEDYMCMYCGDSGPDIEFDKGVD